MLCYAVLCCAIAVALVGEIWLCWKGYLDGTGHEEGTERNHATMQCKNPKTKECTLRVHHAGGTSLKGTHRRPSARTQSRPRSTSTHPQTPVRPAAAPVIHHPLPGLIPAKGETCGATRAEEWRPLEYSRGSCKRPHTASISKKAGGRGSFAKVGVAIKGSVGAPRSYHIISYHIMSYHIISYHIISYHIISYHIISYHIISYHIISYHIISYHIISYHIISYHIISYHIILHHIMSYHITSCHVMSCHVMSCHAMSCHVMSCYIIFYHIIDGGVHSIMTRQIMEN